jgi:DNA-binding CsgD family transcriptional regulator/ArsR family metal-binding transcriptional regulator
MCKEKPFITGYSDLSLTMPGPASRMGSGSMTDVFLIACFTLDRDASKMFPYINAVVENSVYQDDPSFIKFMLDNVQCALSQEKGSAAPFEDRCQAIAFMDRLCAFLDDIYLRKDAIRPNHKTHRPVSVIKILKLLPGTNCGKCGFATCMAFAAALSRQQTFPDWCPEISQPIAEQAIYPVCDHSGNLVSTVTLEIDTSKIKYAIREKQAYIRGLEKRLVKMSQSVERNVSHANDTLPAPLTERELEVLRHVAQGATNMEISKLLDISPHTVKSHVIHIFNKLGVDDRTQAAVWAAHQKLI